VGNKVGCKTIRRRLDSIKIEFKFHLIEPRKVLIVVDATYFGKRADKTEFDGLMVFVDALTGQAVWARFLKNETNDYYQEGLNYLESRGFEILGVLSDGKRGLAKRFKNYPYQVCQFHIQKGISNLLTKNPKAQAGKELKIINDKFIKLRATEDQMGYQLALLCKRHAKFLSEKSPTDSKKYKHTNIIKALNKYKNNLKYMFTFQTQEQLTRDQTGAEAVAEILKRKDRIFPNTTNDIDGGVFSPTKKLLGNHGGLTKPRRTRMIIEILNHRGKNLVKLIALITPISSSQNVL
jgi:hypothetical protein